ncbi:MAG: type III secretion system export apparatus subunit SctU [Paraburkholderia tropica]|uniref:Type III secretion protein U n=1 Tax=Paraburkholderia tropica TaxID=92647 RepID=A0ABX5MSH0_9BURK|nr:type III secretion system export apparatus subunit SctU [Paraburkholderia tropica]MDE1144626.1 type III secretion system export apparatus subunit SctU [Paraburkholderia tropica]PXX17516.1 type III secretion protein U [Paraburkholderia tropica]PZW84698.1 type III secretion protein U [Paraburkholderia tropica]
MSEEKTEQPTAKKLKDARKEGQVSRSSDLTDAISMAAVVVLLAASASQLSDIFRAVMTLALDFVHGDHSIVNMQTQLYTIGGLALKASVPIACAAALAAVAAGIGQVGLQIATKPVTPNLNAVSPGAGLKRIFSIRTVIESVKMVVKAAIIFAVMWMTIKWLFPLIVGSLYQPLPGLTRMFWDMLLKLLMVASAVFVLIGAADVKLQQFMFLKKMKMSKDEVKREHKNQEGDPRIKGERRRLAREILNSPPRTAKVGLANMMVVNPTHYAVAVRYAPAEHPLPRVIAKGMDDQAMLLRRAAHESGVPIVGNPPVARALYKIGVDEPIPEELFETVAAILRWVDAIGARKDAPAPASDRDATPLH